MGRSRRNLIKLGVIGVSAAFASLTTTRPSAGQTNPNGQPVQNPGQHGQNQCFLKGTTIRTPAGDRKIEDLVIGDLLPTVFGGICPIQWIGRYSLKNSDPTKAWVKKALPVRVARSALGPRCSVWRSVCHEGARTAHRWRPGDSWQPDQRHDDYCLQSARA